MKQPKQNLTTAEVDQDLLTRLAAGELSGWPARRLRYRIVRDANLRREWEATAALWQNLGALHSEPAPTRPLWPRAESKSTASSSKSPIWTLGGIAMHKNIAIAAIAGLTLTTVSAGAFVTNKWLRDPFLDFQDTQKHVWRVAGGNFRGQIKQYDAKGNSLGSTGTDFGDGHLPLTAEVMVDGRKFHLTGTGRHTLHDAAGAVIGYADLVPETPAERAAGHLAYLHRTGIDEVLSLSHGDVNDATQDFGFFGEHREITYRLTGGGQARFTRRDNHHVILNAYTTQSVLVNSPAPTVLQLTQKGATQTLRHLGDTADFTLPNGIPVHVELLPR